MVSGIVSYVNEKAYGDATLHSFRLADDSNYYNCGTTRPAVSKGQLVEFEAVDGKKPGAKQVNVNSITVLKEATTEVVEPSRGTFRKTWPKKDVAKDDYWNKREERDISTQQVIQLQSSRNSAIELAKLIMDSGCIDMEKVAKAKKQAVIEDLVDALTDKFERQANAKRAGTVESSPEIVEAQEKIDDGEWE